ncbi:MAG: helix-turn-helix transcriptional regulator [Deltaproteobacteria bacterium]|nr:MAG: helix-turn-helix transcriptional regulator [Deltaproteobacteria bacterium]
MARSKKAVSCPAETTLKIIGGRWKLMILRQLAAGASRFGELHRDLNGISEKILTQHLRELEEDGVISRKIYPEVPAKVEYALTPSGKTLKPIIEAMHEWGITHSSRDKNF